MNVPVRFSLWHVIPMSHSLVRLDMLFYRQRKATEQLKQLPHGMATSHVFTLSMLIRGLVNEPSLPPPLVSELSAHNAALVKVPFFSSSSGIPILPSCQERIEYDEAVNQIEVVVAVEKRFKVRHVMLSLLD